MKTKKPYPSKGDTVKVKKGCYKGLKATLLNRGCRVTGDGESKWLAMWYATVDGIRTVVYEDELQKGGDLLGDTSIYLPFGGRNGGGAVFGPNSGIEQGD